MIDVSEFALQFQVRDFTRVENGDRFHCSMEWYKTFDAYLLAKIYPDGYDSENEGHVSVVIENYFIERVGKEARIYQFTLSVMDVDGRSRFPQSFQIDMEFPNRNLLKHNPLKVERFIRKSVLLDSREELLPEDTLTMRCEVVSFSMPYKSSYEMLPRIGKLNEEESWFLRDEAPKRGEVVYLDLRNPDSPLCTRLRQKSELFHNLFQVPSKGNEDHCFPFTFLEYDLFLKMLYYIRCESVECIDNTSEYCRLYKMTDFFGVPDLHEICREHLKQHLTWNWALNTLDRADFYQDSELRTVAFKLALSHWKAVRSAFKPKMDAKGVIRELKCAAKVLNLEDGDCDRLSDLAARQVHLNMEILRHSPTWSIFSSEMPDLAKVILSWDSYAENKPVEKYKEHAVSYDFYT